MRVRRRGAAPAVLLSFAALPHAIRRPRPCT